MGVRLVPLECGWIEGSLASFLAGGEGRVRLPVPAWLVQHPRGTLLFDAGMHVDVQHDPRGRLGPIANVMTPRYVRGEEVAARLAERGVDAARVDLLACSHLHFDHAGGLAQVPNARLLVQRTEWEAGRDPDLRRANFYDPRDFDLGHTLQLLDGEHDVFGDGAVVCLPTPGHTPGHQSLRVVTESGPVVLTADACYFRRTLAEDALPPFAHDFAAMRRSLHRLRRLAAAGDRLHFGHDPEQWGTLCPAPAAGS